MIMPRPRSAQRILIPQQKLPAPRTGLKNYAKHPEKLNSFAFLLALVFLTEDSWKQNKMQKFTSKELKSNLRRAATYRDVCSRAEIEERQSHSRLPAYRRGSYIKTHFASNQSDRLMGDRKQLIARRVIIFIAVVIDFFNFLA
jgi:hypothetical protein